MNSPETAARSFAAEANAMLEKMNLSRADIFVVQQLVLPSFDYVADLVTKSVAEDKVGVALAVMASILLVGQRSFEFQQSEKETK